MNDLRTAAQRALEACEQRLPLKGQAAIIDELNNLRAALAQQAEPVEPVAWAEAIIDDLHALHDTELIREVDSGDALIRLDAAIAAVEEAEQRHTSLPQQAPLMQEIARLHDRVKDLTLDVEFLSQPSQRKPLTDEEIYSLFRTAGSPTAFARAIERALGIKE